MIYDLIAPIYDEINGELDYAAWADFFERILRENAESRPSLVLDLGCGTGKMTLELARRGYDMTGVDYSEEMLSVARTRAEAEGLTDILWLSQDFTELDLYGTVDLTVSCLDCLNHITDPSDLDRVLALVHNFLVPDGLFIFDINGRHKFDTVYADRSYVFEGEGGVCVWQNDYNEKTHLCDFYITLFEEVEDGRYERYDEIQTERMYTLRSMKNRLTKAGFELVGAYSDYALTPATDESDRIYIVAKCKK